MEPMAKSATAVQQGHSQDFENGGTKITASASVVRENFGTEK